MSIRAQSADGEIHEFPDGTDDAVIDRTMKRYVAERGGDAPLAMDRAAFDRQEAAPPPQSSLGDRMGRQLGLGMRAAGEGVTALGGVLYDAAGAVQNAATLGINDLTGTDIPYAPRFNELYDRAADSAGLPEPETGGERLMSAGVRGASSMLAGGPGAATARNVALATTGAVAGEKVYQKTDNPWLAMFADLGVNFGPSLAAAGARVAARGGNQGQARIQSAVSDFERAGASPTLGQATGSAVYQGAESLMSRAPGATAVMRRAGARTAEGVGNKLADIAGGETADTAGRAIQSGIKGFVDRFKARSSTLYDDVDRHISPTTAADISGTQAALAKLVNPVPGAPSVGEVLRNPKIVQLEEALRVAAGNTGTVPYAALKAVRSAVGEMLSGNELVSGAPRAQIKMLYGALSDDMASAAAAAGPDATKALNRATQFYRSGLGRIEGSLERLSKIEDPERLANALARGDVTTLLAARRSVTPAEWLTVAKAQAGRLGIAKAGAQNAEGSATSTETFLTNWSKLDKRAQDVMFGAIPGNPKMADDLRAIARVAEAVRKSGGVLANPSGTAGSLLQASAGGALLVSLLRGDFSTASIVMGGGTAANITARLLTSPRAVRLLAESTKWPKSRLPALVARLNQIAEREVSESPEDETQP